ncbi:MAG: hypothetical protein MJ204_05990, partial [Bacteroidales bacterium]|nr:hypothetical protein [Bacteroidales bacterium]
MLTTILLYFAIAYAIIAGIVFIYLVVDNREEIITGIRELGIFDEWDGTFKGALLTIFYLLIFISVCIVAALLSYILSPFLLYYTIEENREREREKKENNTSNDSDST